MREQEEVEGYFIGRGVLGTEHYSSYWIGLAVPSELPSTWPMFDWVVKVPGGNR